MVTQPQPTPHAMTNKQTEILLKAAQQAYINTIVLCLIGIIATSDPASREVARWASGSFTFPGILWVVLFAALVVELVYAVARTPTKDEFEQE